MNQPSRLLVVEIRTIDNPGFDLAQLSTLTYFGDSQRLYLSDDLESIRTAIVDAILDLGSNYRHPLLFDVQVINASIASNHRPQRQRRRRTKK
ncbi:MAG TPA: hypothetical protein V6C71_08730 [Coleofasciculaceae cyanobacterium]